MAPPGGADAVKPLIEAEASVEEGGFNIQSIPQALSRPPTARELALAVELVGAQPRREGVEDLLWSVTMLPEFQLTY